MNILPYIIQKKNRSNGVIITFIDINERIRNLKEVQKLNSDHENFIYSVSPDLKNPILNVQSLIETWKEIEDRGGAESIEIVDLIDASVKNVQNIINKLGNVSRTTYNLTKESERVSFENILEDVKLTLKDNI